MTNSDSLLLQVEITDLERRHNQVRQQRDMWQNELLEACKEGRLEDVPKLTVKWQEQVEEKKLLLEQIRSLRKQS